MRHALSRRPEPPASAARAALTETLHAIEAAQDRSNELDRRWKVLKDQQSLEAANQRTLDVQIENENAAMRAWVLSPKGQPPEPDLFARECNEAALANARRIAETARAAEPTLVAERTKAVHELQRLEAERARLVDEILLEQGTALCVELAMNFAQVRINSAKVEALFSLFHGRADHVTANKVQAEGRRAAKDGVDPTNDDIAKARAFWADSAATLAHDPEAAIV